MKQAFTGFENNKKHRLGQRAFMMFLVRRIKYFLLLVALTVAVWYAQPYIPETYAPWGFYAGQLLTVFSIVFFLLIFLRTYLEYRYYTYFFAEEAFMMTSGYVMRTETAALYHQIQNVNIVRSPMDRLIGVSRIVIYMIGDRSSPQNQILLPGVGKTKARYVQQELLSRARKHFNLGNQNG